ncbi:MAG: peptidase dimerization domain-containing protein [Oscillospiraceae bacterium]
MAIVDEKLKSTVNELKQEVFPLSCWLTDHPEISGKEEKSCAYIVDFLRRHGYEVQTPCGISHSFKAKLKGIEKKGYPKIAILCEYDALPDIGHACGHSLSCGISILTALALTKAYPDLPLQIDLVGTPAEESVGGKIEMAKNHAFDEYDLAIMSHLDNDNCPQSALLASNDMLITFHGKPAHSSGNPWDGINAYNAAQLFSHAGDMLRQHLTPDCQLHGIITEGGSAPNIVPDKVVLDYYLRSATLKGLENLREKLTKCVEGAAIATGCTYDIEQRWDTYCDIFYPRETMQEIINIYDELGMTHISYEKGCGSSDVGNVDLVTPCLCLYCKCSDVFTDFHSPDIVNLLYGERGLKTLYDGTIVMAAFIELLATHPEKFQKLKDEHAAYHSRKV